MSWEAAIQRLRAAGLSVHSSYKWLKISRHYVASNLVHDFVREGACDLTLRGEVWTVRMWELIPSPGCPDSPERVRDRWLEPRSTSRALLRDVSFDAMRDGLSVGMPIEKAKRVCPTACPLTESDPRPPCAWSRALRGLGNPPILLSRKLCESLQDHATDPALSKRKNGVNLRLVSHYILN